MRLLITLYLELGYYGTQEMMLKDTHCPMKVKKKY